MNNFSDLLYKLENGENYRFADWSNKSIPKIAAGAYTIWHRDKFIYVGMSGRGLTEDKIERLRFDNRKPKGLYERLKSHASGGRAGDKFCLYICDRFILLTLSQEQIELVAKGFLHLDKLTKEYIRKNYNYRFVECLNGKKAEELESLVKKGSLSKGKPILNPA